MKKLDWIAVVLVVAIFALGSIPTIATTYQFRPGAGQQLTMLLLLGGLVVGFWWWVREFTYDKPSFRRRKREWEDPSDDES